MELVLYVLGAVVTAGGAVKATVYIFNGVRKVTRSIDAIERLVEAELTPNHGSSMKDQLSYVKQWIHLHEELHEKINK